MKRTPKENMRWYLEDVRTRLSILKQHLTKATPADFFLDAGCGSGYFVFWMARKMVRCAVGLDLDRQRVKDAWKKSKLAQLNSVTDFVVGDISHMPFRDTVFTLVLCTEVIEHVPEWRSATAELLRVVRGTLIVSTPSSSNPLAKIARFIVSGKEYAKRMAEVGHLHSYDVFTLLHDLSSHGVMVDVESMRFLGYPLDILPSGMGRVLESEILQRLYARVFIPLDRFLTAHFPLRYFGSTVVLSISKPHH